MDAPTPKLEQLKTRSIAVCPNCGVWVGLKAKRKNGEYSLFEYKRHYTREHGGS